MDCFKKTRPNLLLLILIIIIVPLINSEHVKRDEHMTHTHTQPETITIPQINDNDELFMGIGKNPFWLKEQNFMLWLHIISMIISFGTLIPIGIVLGFANVKSIWYINIQSIGILIIFMGFFFGVMFGSSKSQDIYPSNFHSKFGWLILISFLLHTIFGFIKFIINEKKNNKNDKVKYINISISDESNESLVDSRSSSVDNSSSTSSSHNESLLLDSSKKEYLNPSNPSKNNFHSKIPSSLLFSKNLNKIIYNLSSLILIFFIYTQFLLGFITLSDTCHDESLGNCLAHYIKGSIFFWFGLVAFIRYLGFFENFGWEWNLLPLSSLDNFNDERFQKGKFSFSLLESIIIFLYGIINTFLEHTGKDQSWNHRDVQHATLAFMWWWAGLLGIILENKNIRKVLFSKSKIPIANPIPSIIFIITAISISSHHQRTEFSLGVHRQFGGFLLLAGITLMLSNKSLSSLFDDVYNFDINFVLNLVISLSFITLSFVTILLFIYKYSLSCKKMN
ncbi:integral membrane protein [Rhizophagus clarus]|uniref:Integral membrane protein n=1 Tax=Rhizophagus clarus TaxID=94130 RepID=A0A8H3LQT7_9GLOM|nr:integral membrane protein [Rhizophagus clarus]